MNANKTTKKCNYCQEYKPLLNMVKNHKQKDGYLPLCLACKRIKNAKTNKFKGLSKTQASKSERGEYGGAWLGDAAVYL